MKAEAFAAIQTIFDASVGLSYRFPEGCYLNLGPTDTDGPTCVVSLISGEYDHSTLHAIRSLRIQFSVYCEDDSFGFEAIRYLHSAFDFTDMGFTGFMEMRPINDGFFKDDEGTYNFFAEYELSYSQ